MSPASNSSTSAARAKSSSVPWCANGRIRIGPSDSTRPAIVAPMTATK